MDKEGHTEVGRVISDGRVKRHRTRAKPVERERCVIYLRTKISRLCKCDQHYYLSANTIFLSPLGQNLNLAE